MKSILLVEDNAFILDVYSIYFKKEGYRVDIAADGQMALDKIKNNPPDLLVLDMDLPKINGCQLLKILRQEAATKDLKVVVISNYNQNDFCPDIARLGVMQYFLKTTTAPEEITKAVREILK